jgi:hypothetical protein
MRGGEPPPSHRSGTLTSKPALTGTKYRVKRHHRFIPCTAHHSQAARSSHSCSLLSGPAPCAPILVSLWCRSFFPYRLIFYQIWIGVAYTFCYTRGVGVCKI